MAIDPMTMLLNAARRDAKEARLELDNLIYRFNYRPHPEADDFELEEERCYRAMRPHIDIDLLMDVNARVGASINFLDRLIQERVEAAPERGIH